MFWEVVFSLYNLLELLLLCWVHLYLWLRPLAILHAFNLNTQWPSSCLYLEIWETPHISIHDSASEMHLPFVPQCTSSISSWHLYPYYSLIRNFEVCPNEIWQASWKETRKEKWITLGSHIFLMNREWLVGYKQGKGQQTLASCRCWNTCVFFKSPRLRCTLSLVVSSHPIPTPSLQAPAISCLHCFRGPLTAAAFYSLCQSPLNKAVKMMC